MKMKSLFIQLTTLPEDNTPTEPEVKQEDISEIFKYLKSKI